MQVVAHGTVRAEVSASEDDDGNPNLAVTCTSADPVIAFSGPTRFRTVLERNTTLFLDVNDAIQFNAGAAGFVYDVALSSEPKTPPAVAADASVKPAAVSAADLSGGIVAAPSTALAIDGTFSPPASPSNQQDLLPASCSIRNASESADATHLPTERKRQRDVGSVYDDAIRAALALRSSTTPMLLRARSGESGVDDYLSNLGRSIAGAIAQVRASSETERAKLRSTRAALHAAIDERCDELKTQVDKAESSKISALERQLNLVDDALQRWRSQRSAAAEAAASLDDDEFAERHAELNARLDDAESQLVSLRVDPVVLPHIELQLDVSTLHADLATFGKIVAPVAFTASDFKLKRMPFVARPGRQLQLRLSLYKQKHLSYSDSALSVALQFAATTARLEASLMARDAEPQKLIIDIAGNAVERRVDISIAIPCATPRHSWVCVSSGSLSGKPLVDLKGPRIIPIGSGVRFPLTLQLSGSHVQPISLSISQSGHLFIARVGSSSVCVFGSDGSPLPEMSLAELGLTSDTGWTSCASGASPMVIFADNHWSNPKLIAVDPDSGGVRWSSPHGFLRDCSGLSTLSRRKPVVVFASQATDMLHALNLSDGTLAASLRVPGLGIGLAADPMSGALFGSVWFKSDGRCAINRFLWTGDAIVWKSVVISGGEWDDCPHLAVVPGLPGKRKSYLIAGSDCRGGSELLVLALPDLTLVHTHKLEGVLLTAIAADPSGEALAVADSSAVRILGWPLPGMNPLE